MNKCHNSFTGDEMGIDLRDEKGNFIHHIACKYCIKDLKKAIREYEKTISKEIAKEKNGVK